MDSFFILYKMTFKVFENLKILQNLGIKLESRQSTVSVVSNGITLKKHFLKFVFILREKTNPISNSALLCYATKSPKLKGQIDFEN